MLLAMGLGAILVGLVVWLVAAGPGTRLRLARFTGSVDFVITSVHTAPRGLVLAERASLPRAGEVGRISFVGRDGTLRSRLFDRERGVLGVTDGLVWTDAPGRIALRLPGLDDGPSQGDAVRSCGLRPVEVTVDPPALRVTAEDGTVWLCEPETGRKRPVSEASGPSTSSDAVSELGLQTAGHVSTVVWRGNTVAEGLLDASVARESGSPRALVRNGEMFAVFRRSLAEGSALWLGRFGREGPRWSTELSHDGCRLIEAPQFVPSGERVLVVGRADRGTCVLAVDLTSGGIMWSRAIDG